jgi:hypothetical protein
MDPNDGSRCVLRKLWWVSNVPGRSAFRPGDHLSHRSTTVLNVRLLGGLVDWRSRRDRQGHVVGPVPTLLGEGEVRIFSPQELEGGAVVLPEPWTVRYIIEHPDELRNLTRWQFQEFSAALLERMGMRVTLGPRGADGGVDDVPSLW